MTQTIHEKRARAGVANKMVWGRCENQDCYHCYDASIAVQLKQHDLEIAQALFIKICNALMHMGFKVGVDEQIKKNYPILSPTHRYARRGDLECKLEYSGHLVNINFYQNVIRENNAGGEYDFDKLKKMPFLIRMRFLWTRWQLQRYLADLGFSDVSDHEPELAIDKIRRKIETSYHSAGAGILEWNTDRDYNNRDAHYKLLVPGQVKYFYRWGRLGKGVIYYNLNNMWWVHTGAHDHANLANFELFDFDPALPRRRRLGKEERARKLVAAKQAAVAREDYARAAVLRDLIKAI